MSNKEPLKELVIKTIKLLAVLVVLICLLIGSFWMFIQVDWRVAAGIAMLAVGRKIANKYEYLVK